MDLGAAWPYALHGRARAHNENSRGTIKTARFNCLFPTSQPTPTARDLCSQHLCYSHSSIITTSPNPHHPVYPMDQFTDVFALGAASTVPLGNPDGSIESMSSVRLLGLTSSPSTRTAVHRATATGASSHRRCLQLPPHRLTLIVIPLCIRSSVLQRHALVGTVAPLFTLDFHTQNTDCFHWYNVHHATLNLILLYRFVFLQLSIAMSSLYP
ncbi:hypothetical protein C8F04DRAFT_584056 [Mycena alexandri]|uniref:Uncharacterized protein n=1 Tax=Mycena alexandri TaxID=1745969 RepID=A0AAD6SVP1_9AGAR|nr:hypothetical protein C8F04DRAFT_584056 [Mycena alexandri]